MFRPLLFFVALLGLASVSCSSVGKLRSDYTKDLQNNKLPNLFEDLK
jgi:hypothetical protein